MPFLMLLLPLLSGLPGILGQFFTAKTQLAQAQLNANLAIEQAKIGLASQIAQAEMEVSKTIIGATSPHFKYFTFFMWFGPYMLQIIRPSLGQIVFQNMAGMPPWYAQSCVAIMFTVWGISVAAPVVNNIFNSLGNFFQASRTDKIAMKAVDKKAFFDALRHLNGNVTPADVSKYSPILDEVENEISNSTQG
jgi:hypothetical protein